jgi:hypothetical protein
MARILRRFDLEQLHQLEELLQRLLMGLREVSPTDETAEKYHLPQP